MPKLYLLGKTLNTFSQSKGQASVSQNVVSVKLIVSYDVTMLFFCYESLLTINFTLFVKSTPDTKMKWDI